MLWAAACLYFFGFLRSGEIVAPSERSFDIQSHLCFGDVRIDNREAPTLIRLRTDPFRQGVTLHIGATNAPLCPVAAVLSYMVARGNAPGPWEDDRYLTWEKFVSSMRRALDSAGLIAKNFAGHSFRIGAATMAARCGIQDALIKTLGRWESSAYVRYIRTAPAVYLAPWSRGLTLDSTRRCKII